MGARVTRVPAAFTPTSPSAPSSAVRWRGHERSSSRPERLDCSRMEGSEHSSAELTISVKVPCQECGGRGYVETIGEGGHVVGDPTKECLTCGGRGLVPEDMPLSEFANY